MRAKIAKNLQKNSFWLALLCHLLLLCSFSIPFTMKPLFPKQKTVALYIPSYVTKSEPAPMADLQQPLNKAEKNIETDKHGIEKPLVQQTQANKEAEVAKESHAIPRPEQFEVVNSPQHEQPVHLIGEKKIDAPLLKLIGQGISQHLVYPKIALDFNLRGVVLIRFVIHPDGRITDVQRVKSSSAEVLDDAAISAISSMSPLYNAGKYVDKPKSLVFGIIFG